METELKHAQKLIYYRTEIISVFLYEMHFDLDSTAIQSMPEIRCMYMLGGKKIVSHMCIIIHSSPLHT